MERSKMRERIGESAGNEGASPSPSPSPSLLLRYRHGRSKPGIRCSDLQWRQIINILLY
ncbi:hypothetical protein TIFTF001_035682 [Ficus carica]|uniref:Uncharacterized protein n=1 Tax=Ficus carica TaxID=3494 RepID=A0AA88E211_FICCA|nr:hypothetical protein TIFTF001_035682 [Ficus carica]